MVSVQKRSYIHRKTLKVEQALGTVGLIIDRLIREAHTFIGTERKALQKHEEVITNAAQKEIARLQDQNAAMLRLLNSEKEVSKRGREELIQRVSSLLTDFSEQRDRSLREAVLGVRQGNEYAMDTIHASELEQVELLTSSISRGRAWDEELDRTVSEGKKASQSGFEVRLLCIQCDFP